MSLVLGSTSSARIKILKNLGIEFETRVPLFDERSHPLSDDPVDYCQKLAYLKNLSLQKTPREIVITCDTIVYHAGRIYNKPTSYEDAFSMLKALAGSTHEVISALSVAHEGQILSSSERNLVTFHPLSDEQIEKFLQDPSYMHRSGAYTVTGHGALIIKQIEGSYESIIGLPLNSLETLLQNWNLSLWEFIL